jgi:hypothetical protein
MPDSQKDLRIEMMPSGQTPLRAQLLACWNWKCALMSATARSLVYLAALARSRPHGRLSIILVEVAYSALTAGIYAGLQQRALAFRSRAFGNLTIALGVPALAQAIDWLAHRFIGAPVPLRAMVSVTIFAFVSGLFNLYVMRRGVFLSGRGHSLGGDFRRIPRLLLGFVIFPVTSLISLAGRSNEAAAESEAVM